MLLKSIAAAIFLLQSCNGKQASSDQSGMPSLDQNSDQNSAVQDQSSTLTSAQLKAQKKKERLALEAPKELKEQELARAQSYTGPYRNFYKACLVVESSTLGQKIFIQAFMNAYVGDNGTCEEALEKIPQVKVLKLENEGLDDLALLSEFPHLEELYLANNYIADITPLKALKKLLKLSLGRNKITDISTLSELTYLVALGLTRNNISDISALKSLSHLKVLGLGRNFVSDLRPLAGLSKIAYLSASKNRLENVEVLSKLPELRQLNISQNHVVSVAPLLGLANLYQLDFSENGVSSLEEIRKFKIPHERLFFAKNMFAEFPLSPNLKEAHTTLEESRDLTCSEYREWGVDSTDLFPFVECDLNL